MAVVKRKRRGKPRRGRAQAYYEAEVFVSGVRIASQCFDTRAAAEAWHDETKARYESGRGVAGEMRLADVIAHYRRHELAGKLPPTVFSYGRVLEKIEASPLAAVTMARLGGGDVKAFLDWLGTQAYAADPRRTSFRRELKILRVVLGYFRDEFDAKYVSPVTRRHGVQALYRGPVPGKPKDHYLTADECRRFFAALARQRDPVYHDIAVTQVVLGLRVGEAAGIRRDAIDFERGTVTVKRTREWRGADGKALQEIANRTKTPESSRQIPLEHSVARILRKAIDRNPDAMTVFLNLRGRLPPDSTIRAAFQRAYRVAGIRWTGTHICRDTNATLGLLGARMEAVQKNLGHTSRRQTEGYARVLEVISNNVPQTVSQQIYGDKAEANPGENPGTTGQRAEISK